MKKTVSRKLRSQRAQLGAWTWIDRLTGPRTVRFVFGETLSFGGLLAVRDSNSGPADWRVISPFRVDQSIQVGASPDKKRDRTLSVLVPHGTVWSLLAPRILRPCRRSIPLTETLPAPVVASLDEARSEIVAPAVAACELLGLWLALGPDPRRPSQCLPT